MFKDYLHLHFIVLLWGFTAIIGKAMELDSIVLVFYRTLIAAVALWAVILITKRQNKVSRQAKVKMLLTGFIVSLHWILFFASAQISKVSICLVGMATTTLFTAFLEPMIMKTRLKWYEILLGVMVIAGLYTIYQSEYQYSAGLLLALGSAFLAALFSIINKKFTNSYGPLPITLFEMIGACVCTLLLIPVYVIIFDLEVGVFAHQLVGDVTEGVFLIPTTLEDWGGLLFLSLICTVYAFYFSVEILKRLSAFNVNLIINLEPVYGIILAYFYFGKAEKMTDTFYLGGAIILLAVGIYPILEKKFGKKEIA